MSPRPGWLRHSRNVEQCRAEITKLGLILPRNLIERRARTDPSMTIPVHP